MHPCHVPCTLLSVQSTYLVLEISLHDLVEPLGRDPEGVCLLLLPRHLAPLLDACRNTHTHTGRTGFDTISTVPQNKGYCSKPTHVFNKRDSSILHPRVDVDAWRLLEIKKKRPLLVPSCSACYITLSKCTSALDFRSRSFFLNCSGPFHSGAFGFVRYYIHWRVSRFAFALFSWGGGATLKALA